MPSRFEDFKRASHVVDICLKQGLGYFVDLYGLKWHLHLFKRIILRNAKKPESLPERIRAVMEELGGAYIKLGQLLSIRPDLIPSEYCEEFKHLLDDIAPISFSEVKKTVEFELKQPLHKVFAHFDKFPLGSASVAQVHKAKLLNGKNVVVKVQRPGVDKKFREDIDIIYYLAHKIQKHSDLRRVHPLAIVEEFEKYTNKELNFINEARNIDKFYQGFKETNIIIPKVFWQFTTPKILVMDYLDGKKLTEAKKLSQEERRIIAYRLADASLKQLFEIGVFHADLHPGNILVMQNNKIGLIDFGIVGSLDGDTVQKLMNAYIGIVQQDYDAVTKTLLEVAPPSTETDVDQLKAEVKSLLEEWFVPSNNMRYTQMMYLVFEVGIKNKLKFPRDLILFGKSAMSAEGTCMEVYPQFNFTEHAKPKVMQLLKKQHAPLAMLNKFAQKTSNFGRSVGELPSAALSLINKFQKEPVKIGIDNTDVRHLGFDINTSSNRLSYSMLIASLIIGGSLLVNTGPALGNYSVISMTAFLLAGIMLVPLLVSVVREGNKMYDSHRN